MPGCGVQSRFAIADKEQLLATNYEARFRYDNFTGTDNNATRGQV
jgi:hypothetical protein